jgi:hypothetical protein
MGSIRTILLNATVAVAGGVAKIVGTAGANCVATHAVSR